MKSSFGKVLLRIARNAIEESLDKHKISDINKSELLLTYPELREMKATFVTLNTKSDKTIKDLRGCIGTLTPVRTLFDDIEHNAKASAFRDPRFTPLQKKELKEIFIEVSLLTVPEKLTFASVDELRTMLIPGKHGVIIKKGFNRAVFLPDVWFKLPDFEQFFSHLCKKAGLSSGCVDSIDDLYIFYVEKYTEDGDKS